MPATELTDLADLGLDDGGHLLVARALARLAPGERLAVSGSHPALRLHLALGGQIDVHPAGKALFKVPGALTVAKQDKCRHRGLQAGLRGGLKAARASVKPAGRRWGLPRPFPAKVATGLAKEMV